MSLSAASLINALTAWPVRLGGRPCFDDGCSTCPLSPVSNTPVRQTSLSGVRDSRRPAIRTVIAMIFLFSLEK
ncbi:hypothetical protein AMECASPLE_000946 [Ameca splendens]|uniref:Secreted protein n=1 Tax=Ameca splendens TaxID=208324 RepID=A0ABV0ZHK8_9TELE